MTAAVFRRGRRRGQFVAQWLGCPQYMHRLFSRRLLFSSSERGPLLPVREVLSMLLRSMGPEAVPTEVGVEEEGLDEATAEYFI